MLSVLPSTRIYLAVGATDVRKSFDGLSELARSVVGVDPLSGHLFAFCNRRRDRVKILFWDSSGFCLLHKRLEKGTFAWPALEDVDRRVVELAGRELLLLLAGVDLSGAKRRRWYEHAR